jgi:integrase
MSVGRKQIWRSLKTKSYSVARSQARKLLLAVDQLFMQIRNTMDSRLINAMAADFGLDLLKVIDEIRPGMSIDPPNSAKADPDNEFVKKVYSEVSKSPNGRDFLEICAAEIADRIQECIFSGKPDELQFVAGAYEIFLDKYGLDIPPSGSKEEKELKFALAQSAKLAFLIEQERVHGTREESELQHRLISKWNADLPPKKDTGLPVSELLDQYFSVWSKDYRKRPNATEYYVKRKLRDIAAIKQSMVECFGKDIGIKEIDDDKAIEWRDFHIADLQLSNSSMNKYLDIVSAAFRWAVDRQRKYADFNPFEKKQLPEGVKREKTREFSPEELNQYISMLADTYIPKYPENTWIPLIMLYTGMRNNEIAQLFVDDINVQHEIPYFRIWSTDERMQRVKVGASQRDLPIHSKLIELGMLKYVTKMRESGQEQLFPNCTFNERTRRYYDDNLSSRMNTLVDCISADKRLRVYSLRANFKTAIENKFADAAIDAMEGKTTCIDVSGLENFINRAFNDVMGHSAKGSTGDTTYRKVQLKLMHRIVEQAEYPIDTSKLKNILHSSA